MPFGNAALIAALSLFPQFTREAWLLWLALGGGSFLLMLLFYLPSRLLAIRFNLIDIPDTRRDHEVPTPLAGGIMLFTVFHIALISLGMLAWTLSRNLQERFVPWDVPELGPMLAGMADYFPLIGSIVVCSWLLFVVGLVDDRTELGSARKLGFQVFVAILVVLGGVRGEYFMPSPWIGMVLSAAWILGITNAFNLLDNMNGLSAGVAAIVLAHFLAVALLTGQAVIAALLCALLGCSLGFLVFNFPRGRVFLGNAGSYFLGFWIACLSVIATFYFRNMDLPVLAVFFPPLILAVPLYDTLSVIWIRLRRGQPIMQADHNHLSHRLTALGMSRVEAVIAIWILTLVLGLSSLLMYYAGGIGGVIAIVHAALIVLLVILLERTGRREAE